MPARLPVHIHAPAGAAIVLLAGTLSAAHPAGQGGQSRQAMEPPMRVDPESAVQVSRPSDRDTVVEAAFAVPRRVLFDAITRPEHLKHWMQAGRMTLDEAHVDPRTGGGFRYVFMRPNGRKIEVRGTYTAFDPPNGFAYRESYDFSPLQIDVTSALVESGDRTRLTQTLRYRSAGERDKDFDGVASSSREAFANLARYLASPR
jgi:uncharacterized protein YndB with AHSA1/START domain